VGIAQRKIKVRLGQVVRGIKITDSDSKNKVLDELKVGLCHSRVSDWLRGL
jgi:hypothetical protein